MNQNFKFLKKLSYILICNLLITPLFFIQTKAVLAQTKETEKDTIQDTKNTTKHTSTFIQTTGDTLLLIPRTIQKLSYKAYCALTGLFINSCELATTTYAQENPITKDTAVEPIVLNQTTAVLPEQTPSASLAQHTTLLSTDISAKGPLFSEIFSLQNTLSFLYIDQKIAELRQSLSQPLTIIQSSGGGVSSNSIRNLRINLESQIANIPANPVDTDELDEGLTNLYFTEARLNGLSSLAIGNANTASGLDSSAFGYANTASGDYSSASGYSNTASGNYSAASGYDNTASANYASAFGSSGIFGSDPNTASGIKSSAFGYGNTASGDYSSAFGNKSTASTLNSQVFGRSNFTGTGLASVSMGILNNQTGGTINTTTGAITGTIVAANAGNLSTTVGIRNTSSGRQSTVVGYNNIASGDYSSAFGYYNTASGVTASVSGYDNTASANESSAFGWDNTASGIKSSAFGYSNTASGDYSIAVGGNNIANSTVSGFIGAAYGAVALGYGNNSTASGYAGAGSSAVGINNTASGLASSAFGYSNTASEQGSSAFGSSITNNIANSTMIGPSDAAKVTILSSGNVGIGTTAPGAKLQVNGDVTQINAGIFRAFNISSKPLQIQDDTGNSFATFARTGSVWGLTLNDNTANKIGRFFYTHTDGGFSIGNSNNSIPFGAQINMSGSSMSAFGNTGGIDLNASTNGRIRMRLWDGSAFSEGMTIINNGNVGMGLAAPVAKLHVLSATEQLRVGYNVSNYWTNTIGATGGLTMQGVGVGGSFTLSPTAGQNVNLALSGTGDFAVNTNQLYVDTSLGNVGIGTTAPSVALHVVGNGRFSAVGSGAYAFDLNLTTDGTLTTSASDMRLKENVTALDSEDILERMIQLNPSSFTWKSNNAHDIGLIAQDVEEIFPELVFTNPTDGYKGINYSRFSTLLISAVSNLAEKVEVMFAWFGDGSFNVQGDICVDDVCISKDEFKAILQNGTTSTSAPSSNTTSSPVSETTQEENIEEESPVSSNPPLESSDTEIVDEANSTTPEGIDQSTEESTETQNSSEPSEPTVQDSEIDTSSNSESQSEPDSTSSSTTSTESGTESSTDSSTDSGTLE